MRTLYIPAFESGGATQQRHGGVRRTEQLSSSLTYDASLYVGGKVSLTSMTLLCFILGFWYGARREGVKRYLLSSIMVGRVAYHLRCKGLNKKNCVIYLEVLAGGQLCVGDFLRRRGFAYHVFPHNIEFLVPGQYDFSQPAAISCAATEILLYKEALTATVISRYDRSIVSVFNNQVELFPYFPNHHDLARFERISTSRRSASTRRKLLCLGTAHNPPTRAGIETVIKQFSQRDHDGWELLIAGYGTEIFSAYGGCSQVKVLGALDDDALSKLLGEISAVLLYQPATTGFLTKLVEFNLCSVPVLINEDYVQALGLEQHGIYVYSSLNDVNFDFNYTVEKKFERPLLVG